MIQHRILKNKNQLKKKYIFLLIFISFFSYFLLLLNTTKEKAYPDFKESLVNCYWDRNIYFFRGSWYPLKKIPCKETFQEYPPLATYLFATPFLFMSKVKTNDMAKYFMAESNPCNISQTNNFPVIRPSPYRSQYMLIFSLLMGIIGLLSCWVLLSFLTLLHKDYRYALLFLLPGSMFFTFNRFDILPATLVLCAAYAILKNNHQMMAILLGLGIASKIYPIILWPVFFIFLFYKNKRVLSRTFFSLILTIFLISMPLILYAGFSFLKKGLVFHLVERYNHESLYYLLSIPLQNLFVSYPFLINTVFLIFSFSIMPFATTAKIDTPRLLIKWSLLSLYIFMIFLKSYSPQWILWIIFFMILNIKSKRDILNIIAFQYLTWLTFPVADFIYGQPSAPFTILVICKTFLLLYLATELAKELLPQSRLFIFLAEKIPPRHKTNV